MIHDKLLIPELQKGSYDASLSQLYALDGTQASLDCARERAVLRAMHFYADDRWAVEEAQALKDGNLDRLLGLVNDSGLRRTGPSPPTAAARPSCPWSR